MQSGQATELSWLAKNHAVDHNDQAITRHEIKKNVFQIFPKLQQTAKYRPLASFRYCFSSHFIFFSTEFFHSQEQVHQ